MLLAIGLEKYINSNRVTSKLVLKILTDSTFVTSGSS
mgnify:FL=1